MEKKLKIWNYILAGILFCSLLSACGNNGELKAENPQTLLQNIVPQMDGSLTCKIRKDKGVITLSGGYSKYNLQTNEKSKQDFQAFKQQMLQLSAIKFNLQTLTGKDADKQAAVSYVIVDNATATVSLSDDCLTVTYKGKKYSYTPAEKDKTKFQEIFSQVKARFIPELVQDLQNYSDK
ncbi:hypothetical protein PYS60_06180 [Amygdalobacter indicium]|uniref:hypothetical protein n=1 Tax=Amygdalobacter indicium TaxID=3029272 RepID=UPI00279FA7DD|nr:hypothetical protein [Amygdalobacter indicium]WEG34271.1 hypothetical protein PYS60_06180 [Amygdalobacter indicium]